MHVKASSNIAQCPVLRTVQNALHFTSLTDLFTQTPYRLLWEASSHMLQLMREGWLYTYAPLSIARYSFIQLSELEQCKEKKLAQDLNTAAQDSNPGSRSRESEALPLSHCTLCVCVLTFAFGCVQCVHVMKHSGSVGGMSDSIERICIPILCYCVKPWEKTVHSTLLQFTQLYE